MAAGVTIFAGSLVCLDADGYAIPAADTAGLKFAGGDNDRKTNAGQDGDSYVVVRRFGLRRFKLGHALTQADVGKQVFVVDDGVVDLVGATTNDVFAGVLVNLDTATMGWIDVAPAVALHK